MERLLLFCLVFTCMAACKTGRQLSSIPVHATSIAFTEVTIVDVEIGVLTPGMTVVVTGNLITKIGKTAKTKIPANAQVINASGKYMIPGLWDMHVHTYSRFIDFPLELAYGITGIRDMGGTVHHEFPPPGHWGVHWDSLRRWRDEINAGKMLGPRIIAAGVGLDGPNPVWPQTLSIATPNHGKLVVDSLKRQGVDFIKVYQNLTPEIYSVIVAESGRLNLPLAGHLSDFISPATAASYQRSIEHSNFERLVYDSATWGNYLTARRKRSLAPEEIRALIRKAHATFDTSRLIELAQSLIKNKGWNTPTLVWNHKAFLPPDTTLPQLSFVPAYLKKIWEGRMRGRFDNPASKETGANFLIHVKQGAGMLYRRGIQMLAGSDAWNPYIVAGIGLHEELIILVGIGMSPLQAIQTATINPAKYLGREKELGTIEKGKLADLVLLNANPLTDIRNTQKIAAVVANGRYLSREALDKMLADVEEIVKKN